MLFFFSLIANLFEYLLRYKNCAKYFKYTISLDPQSTLWDRCYYLQFPRRLKTSPEQNVIVGHILKQLKGIHRKASVL